MYFYGARVQAIFFLRAQLLELHKNVFEKRHKDVVRNEERIFFGGKAEFLGIQNRHRAQVFAINFACKFAKKGRLHHIKVYKTHAPLLWSNWYSVIRLLMVLYVRHFRNNLIC